MVEKTLWAGIQRWPTVTLAWLYRKIGAELLRRKEVAVKGLNITNL